MIQGVHVLVGIVKEWEWDLSYLAGYMLNLGVSSIK